MRRKLVSVPREHSCCTRRRGGETPSTRETVNALVKLAIDRTPPALPGGSPPVSSRSGRSCPSPHELTSFAAARDYPSYVLPGVGPGTAAREIAGSGGPPDSRSGDASAGRGLLPTLAHRPQASA
jgi:hypothetical protein